MEKKHTVKLVLLVVLILAMPFLFFQYIGQEPMRVEEEASGKIAIVNEDRGYQYEENEPLILGQDIVLTLQNDTDYEWAVTSRSAAQGGLSQQDYDAIVYIESSFSENIMSFRDAVPNRAGVQYEIYNNLNAENQERVQKELESAQLKMNQQIGTQYWRYVSEEVDRVRDNFEEVLQKEEDFLNEMYAFYAPSSEQLASEIDQQRERLTQLFSNSADAAELSESSRQNLEEAQTSFEALTNAVDEYMAYQNDQNEAMLNVHAENERIVSDAVASYQTQLQEGSGTIQDTQAPFSPEFTNDGDSVVALFQDWAISAFRFGNVMDHFYAEMNQNQAASTQAVGGLAEAQEDLMTLYAITTQEERFSNQVDVVVGDRQKLVYADDRPEVERPEAPEEEVEPPINKEVINEINEAINRIQTLLVDLKEGPEEDEDDEENDPPPPGEDPGDGNENPPPNPNPGDDDGDGETPGDSEPETGGPDEGEEDNTDAPVDEEEETIPEEEEEPSGEGEGESLSFTPFHVQLVTHSSADLDLMWQEVEQLLIEVDQVLGDVELKIGLYDEEMERLLGYVKELEDYATYLEEMGNVPELLTNEIVRTERAIFRDLPWVPAIINEPIHVQDIGKLLDYYGELAKLEWAWTQSDDVDAAKMARFIEEDNRIDIVRNRITDSFDTVDSFMDNQSDVEAAGQSAEQAEREFEVFVADANAVLAEVEQGITEEQQAIIEQMGTIVDAADSIGRNLIADWNSTEVDQPPVEDLNGQMVVSNQQTSIGEIQQLASAVQTLDERQGDVISRTDEMYSSVASVQSQSDDLNSRWANNVGNTEIVYEDIATILSNGLSDGHHNDYVYHHLSSPVQVSGEQADGPAQATPPPIIVLVIVLISSLLIGFLTYHYSSVPVSINLSLFGILSIIVGLVISIYGLTIYTMSGSQSIQWTIITVLLVIATAGLIRVAFMTGPWIGWLLSVALVLFYTSPLLDMAMPNFSASNPIADTYISIQAGSQTAFMAGFIPLLLIALSVIAVPIIQHAVANGRKNRQEDDYEM